MKLFSLMMTICILTAGCQVIHLKNGESAKPKYTTEKWHHVGIMSLVEFSDPVSLESYCSSGWKSARTRLGPLQVLMAALPVVAYVYSPQEVSVACN
jgi:hypothetical protein